MNFFFALEGNRSPNSAISTFYSLRSAAVVVVAPGHIFHRPQKAREVAPPLPAKADLLSIIDNLYMILDSRKMVWSNPFLQCILRARPL